MSLGAVSSRHIDGTILRAATHADAPGVAAHLAVLNQAATDVFFEINLDCLTAVRAGHEKLLGHPGRIIVAGEMDDPGTTLWSLSKNGREVRCRVRLVPYGIEIDIDRDGSTVVTRTFEAEAEALAWAQRKRRAREAEGWI